MKKLSALLLVFCWGLLPPVSAQELPQPELPADPLEKSLTLTDDTISLIETIQSDNENLKAALSNVSDMLKAQGELLNEKAKTQARMQPPIGT